MSKKKFIVDVRLKCCYEITAETEEEAVAKAWDWFAECTPDFKTTEICCATCKVREYCQVVEKLCQTDELEDWQEG